MISVVSPLLIFVTIFFVLVIWQTVRRPFFLVSFVLLLLAFWVLVGNPIGLLTSFGGWIILLVMVCGARIVAPALHARWDNADR